MKTIGKYDFIKDGDGYIVKVAGKAIGRIKRWGADSWSLTIKTQSVGIIGGKLIEAAEALEVLASEKAKTPDQVKIHDNEQDTEIYSCFGYYIPQRMNAGIRRWINSGIRPGQFLMAVFENDLMKALGRADDENRTNLAAYSYFLYNQAPGKCYGSPEKVKAWAESGGLKGQAKR